MVALKVFMGCSSAGPLPPHPTSLSPFCEYSFAGAVSVWLLDTLGILALPANNHRYQLVPPHTLCFPSSVLHSLCWYRNGGQPLRICPLKAEQRFHWEKKTLLPKVILIPVCAALALIRSSLPSNSFFNPFIPPTCTVSLSAVSTELFYVIKSS